MSGNSSLSASERKPVQKKPKKPYADFPLFPHATKRWAKKIRGKTHYFGRWDEPDAALQHYLDTKDDLHAGRTPRQKTPDGLTIKCLCNEFLTTKKKRLNTGEITDRTFADYYATCMRIITAFGKTRVVENLVPRDFEQLRDSISEKRGPVALGNEIQRVRMVFKYAADYNLIDRPVSYGQAFKKPSRKVLRLARAANGKRMFEAAELRQMIDTAGVHIKAMILLGINCGFGQSDISSLPKSALDLDSGWVNFPRPKTGVDRRCPLPEASADGSQYTALG